MAKKMITPGKKGTTRGGGGKPAKPGKIPPAPGQQPVKGKKAPPSKGKPIGGGRC